MKNVANIQTRERKARILAEELGMGLVKARVGYNGYSLIRHSDKMLMLGWTSKDTGPGPNIDAVEDYLRTESTA